jgi:transcriptional regulator with XRE-family HTH domain
VPKEKPRVNIGEVIKSYRSQRGLSQGDIERRTGLLRCYLSRVENGHTVPSLETLAKIAEAMDISLADFFPGTETPRDRETQKMLGELSQDEIRFLAEIKRFSTTLSDGDKRLVLAMIRKMATLIPPPVSKKLVIRRTTTVWESWQLTADSRQLKEGIRKDALTTVVVGAFFLRSGDLVLGSLGAERAKVLRACW